MAALTEEQRELILELAEDEELTKTEIARRAGVSRPTIYKVFREEGLDEHVSGEEDGEETYVSSDEVSDADAEEDSEVFEEVGDEDYVELTDGQERRVIRLYEEWRAAVQGQIADELELSPEEVFYVIEGHTAPHEPPIDVGGRGPAGALACLAGGAVLGAAGLYYAMMRGLVGPPGAGRAGK